MFRSLHRKLVLILVLLIVSVMAVVGTFLINSINTFYLNSFYEQMQAVFTTDTIRSMQEAAAEPGTDGAAYDAVLGVRSAEKGDECHEADRRGQRSYDPR